MKKLFLVSLFLMIATVSMIGIASANIIYTYNDDTIYWPGHPYTGIVSPPQYPDWNNLDNYGSPLVSGLAIETSDTGYLLSIKIFETDRVLYDSLFINLDSSKDSKGYEGWDLYVSSDWNRTQMYNVDENNYTYLYAQIGRIGHPSGIATGLTPLNGELFSLIYDGSVLTYTFNGDILLGNDFAVGYSMACANDVILTPEPSILLLLGSGLLGLIATRRKNWLKK
jgi:hypothetical protein